jgi:CHAD domain-containing protein
MPTLIQLERKLFIKRFQRILGKFTKQLDDYILEPTEENIHDIRIAIRRIESAHRVLPKKTRKKQEIQNYVNEAKMLFKINTQIRDFDIICEKLEKQGTSKYSELVNHLKNKREIELKDAHRLAIKLKNKPLPKIKKRDIIESKLNKRFQKIFTELITEIQQNIPVVINDEKKIEELHKLRKDFKKFRYSIELTSNKITLSTSVKSLKKIQDSLGEIHDCDIMLDYLREVKGPNELSEVIRNEILERREKYQQFVQSIHDEEFNPEDLILQF